MGHTRRRFIAGSSVFAICAPLMGAKATVPPSEAWQTLSRSSTLDSGYWSRVRNEYLIEDGLIYLNAGSFGPTLRVAYEAACRNLFDIGSNYSKTFRRNMMGDAVPKFVSHVAGFVGAKPDEVAFTSGTTESINYIANGLNLDPGDEVLTTTHDHSAGVYPWLLREMRFGVNVKQIRLPKAGMTPADVVTAFDRAITPKTRVLSFCHVQFTNGMILPVREICALARSRGIVSVVDGAQAVGMLDFRISNLGCDFYAASFHKWLCSPYGCGLLYVRDEMRERLWPTMVISNSGWMPHDRNGIPCFTDLIYAADYPKALVKYSPNIEYYGSLYRTVALAIDFQYAVGRARIESRVRQLGTRLVEGLRNVRGLTVLTPDDSAHRAGLVTFCIEETGVEELHQKLRSAHNIVSRHIRHPGANLDVIRLSAHIFNSEAEIDCAVGAIREFADMRKR